jgi:ABC-type branched-subunit amino acid transport system substrate-binding protein
LRRVTAVVVAGMVVSTCGVASVVSGGSASAATRSSTPIVVGGDGDLTLNTGISQGFEAGIYRFNKAGGLAGRKIQYTGFLDDGLSSATNLSNAQQLVDNKHVMAIAPVSSAVASASTGTFLQQSKIPFIGWSTSTPFEAARSWGFGINGNQSNPNVLGLWGWPPLLKLTGNTKTPGNIKAAFIAENIAPGITANDGEVAVAKYLGIKVVYQQAPIPVFGATTYAPYAQAIVSSGANLAFETLDAPDAVGLAAALKSAGFKGIIVNGVTYFPGQLASQPNETAALNGVYVLDEFPANENNTPAVKQAQRDLVSVGQKPYLTSGVSIGYWSAILFEQMLRATLKAVGGDPNKVTGATLQATAAHFTYTDPIPGGIGTEYFPTAQTIPTGCGTVVRVVGTNFKQIAAYNCAGSVNVVIKKVLSQKTGQPISK